MPQWFCDVFSGTNLPLWLSCKCSPTCHYWLYITGGRLGFPLLVITNNHCDAFLCSPLQEMRICSAIINLFHLIPAAPQTLVKPLLEVVMKTERAMLIEVQDFCSNLQLKGMLVQFVWTGPVNWSNIQVTWIINSLNNQMSKIITYQYLYQPTNEDCSNTNMAYL